MVGQGSTNRLPSPWAPAQGSSNRYSAVMRSHLLDRTFSEHLASLVSGKGSGLPLSYVSRQELSAENTAVLREVKRTSSIQLGGQRIKRAEESPVRIWHSS